jgi:hypothetical protein
MSRSDLSQLTVRVFVAAVVAGAVWRLLCLFSAPTESRSVLLTAFGGTCGGCLGALGPGWRATRLVSNAIAGAALSLILYYCVRGVVLRSATPPSTVRACGIAALGFLSSMSRTPNETRGQTNQIAARAAALLILTFVIRGIVFLCP